jgi:citrate synthase
VTLLRKFLYLDETSLNDYVSAMEDGLRQRRETKSGTSSDRSGGIDAKVVRAGVDTGRSSDESSEYSDTPPAKFNRLLDLADGNEEAMAWLEIQTLEQLEGVGFGAIVHLECEAYIPDMVRTLASGELGDLFGKAVDLLLILHADHELNCSTATVRTVGSSQADIFASVAAGVNALSGPSHGGANQAVLEMLDEIRDSGVTIEEFLERVKAREVRLMGFGHRVYKNFDPRSKEIKGLATQILDRDENPDELFALALKLEAAALADSYFTERKLYPNVDFYTGVIYRAMGFPTNMFTVLFAIGRLPGWIAHYREQLHDPAFRIARPRQHYIGSPERRYPGQG